MPDRSYTLKYIVDDSGATPKLQNIRHEINNIDRECKGGGAGLRQFEGALRNVGETLPVVNQHIANSSTNVGGLNTSILGLIPAWQVFEVGVQALQNFGEYANTARQHMRELAQDAIKTRDAFRELANLQYHSAPDDEVVASTILAGIKAGSKADDARRFMEQYEGSAPAGRQKGNIKPDIEPDLAIEGMKFGNRVGINPKTAGDLTGVLSQYGKITSVPQAAGKMQAIAHGLNEGRGKLEPLMTGLIETAGTIVEENGGAVATLEEEAVFYGVESLNSGTAKAGTRLKNAVKGMRHVFTKRDEKTGETVPRDEQSKTLLELGVTTQDSFLEAMRKITPKIEEADKSGEGGDTWLRQHGFGQDREIEGILVMARNMPVVEPRHKAAVEQQDGAMAMRKNEEFLHRSKTGMARVVNARKEALNFVVGSKKEYSELGIETGKQKLREEGKAGGTNNWIRHYALDMGGLFPMLGIEKVADKEAKGRYMKALVAEGKKVGVSVAKIYSKPEHKAGTRLMGLEHPVTEEWAEKGHFVMFQNTAALNESIEAITNAGGNPFGGGSDIEKKLTGMAAEDRKKRRVPFKKAPGQLDAFTGQVKAVLDGDTVDVTNGADTRRIRLSTVDAPEKKQKGGPEAKANAERLALGQQVTVQPRKIDQYGRTVGDVKLPGGKDLGQEQARTGNAWWYKHFAPDAKDVAKAEQEARKAKRGVWADPNPQAPWDWRKQTENGKNMPVAIPGAQASAAIPAMGWRTALAATAMGAFGKPTEGAGPEDHQGGRRIRVVMPPEPKPDPRILDALKLDPRATINRIAQAGPTPPRARDALASDNSAKGLPPFQGTEEQAKKILTTRARRESRHSTDLFHAPGKPIHESPGGAKVTWDQFRDPTKMTPAIGGRNSGRALEGARINVHKPTAQEQFQRDAARLAGPTPKAGPRGIKVPGAFDHKPDTRRVKPTGPRGKDRAIADIFEQATHQAIDRQGRIAYDHARMHMEADRGLGKNTLSDAEIHKQAERKALKAREKLASRAGVQPRQMTEASIKTPAGDPSKILAAEIDRMVPTRPQAIGMDREAGIPDRVAQVLARRAEKDGRAIAVAPRPSMAPSRPGQPEPGAGAAPRPAFGGQPSPFGRPDERKMDVLIQETRKTNALLARRPGPGIVPSGDEYIGPSRA